MKKNLRKMLLLGLTGVLLCCASCGSLTGEGRVEQFYQKCERDDLFLYYEKDGLYYVAGNAAETLPETVYIPSHFNGKEVTDYGCTQPSLGVKPFVYLPTVTGVKRMYFPYTFPRAEGFTRTSREKGQRPECLFVTTQHTQDYSFVDHFFDVWWYSDLTIYFSSAMAEKVLDFYSNSAEDFDLLPNKIVRLASPAHEEIVFVLMIANTVYDFNYQGAPNEGVFFIDDFQRGEKITPPPYEPVREGYTFGGWYQDPLCTESWDFAYHTLPSAEYDEEGNATDFIETRLYAKWNVK